MTQEQNETNAWTNSKPVSSHYEWLPVEVENADGGEEIVFVEAYFAEKSYAVDMWDKCGKIGYSIYGEKESKGYVRRIDRPVNSSFLEHIQVFISSGQT
ncbi:Putative gamma-glutamylcyclotransferase At3g02910 [Linum grandiflorum]